jgi:hypothetical protein
MAATAMLDIVVADTENRRAHNTGRSAGEDWIADAVRDTVVMVLCSEARRLVPEECGLEGGNFAGAGGMHSLSSQYTDSSQMAGNFRCSHLLRIGRMGALTPHCAQNPPSLYRRWLVLLDRHLIVQDNEWGAGYQMPIDCPLR